MVSRCPTPDLISGALKSKGPNTKEYVLKQKGYDFYGSAVLKNIKKPIPRLPIPPSRQPLHIVRLRVPPMPRRQSETVRRFLDGDRRVKRVRRRRVAIMLRERPVHGPLMLRRRHVRLSRRVDVSDLRRGGEAGVVVPPGSVHLPGRRGREFAAGREAGATLEPRGAL